VRLRDSDALKPVASPVIKLAALAAVVIASAVAAIVATSGASAARAVTGPWSSPATVSGCAPSSPAQLGFPAASPTTPSGPGAIVCADGAGQLALVPLLGDAPATSIALTTGSGARYRPPFAITTTGSGGIVVAASTDNARSRGAILTEGGATSPTFHAPVELGGPGSPLALARAYLGDTAVASLLADPARPAGSDGIVVVRVQRHFQAAFGRAVKISTQRGAVSALAVALDYRSDALVVWEQGGAIWARELRANGQLWPLQRVGSSAPRPQLQAVVSDDNRAIVSWVSAVGARTHVWMSISGPLARFDARPRLLEAIRDPAGARLPDGSLRMTRLSSEGVLVAWTGEEAGRHAVRAAAVGLDGVKPVATISDPATDAVLADLATGPRAEAVAIWTATAPPAARLLEAARGVVGAGARAGVGPPVGGGALDAAAAGAAVAIDPASDVSIAVWPAVHGIAYAQRRPGA
jgi:hypothetical protein